MAQIPQGAVARFDQRMGWREQRRKPGTASPFSIRGAPDAARLDDGEFDFRAPPMMRRWTGASERHEDSGFGLVLAAVAVVLVVVLLIAVTLMI